MDEMSVLRGAVRDYLSALARTLASVSDEDVASLARVLLEARRRRGTLYLLGNGGSASTAGHAANDLMKTATPPGGRPLRTVSLPDNVSLLTAWANDSGYENAFAGQLARTAREGDVVIAFSGSGESENVLRAVEAARRSGATTVGLAGFAGGRLRDAADLCLVVPARLHGIIEDLHLAIVHALTEALRRGPADAALEAEGVPSRAPALGGDGRRDGEGGAP